MYRVIKRDGREVPFENEKIINAIMKANESARSDGINEMTDNNVYEVFGSVIGECSKLSRTVTVEEIQEIVETKIMEAGYFEVAKRYVRYRHKRELARKMNTTDNEILALIEGQNETMKKENSNKNPTFISTQRDYIAGAVSRDITRRILLPQDISESHDSGILHFHDSDYFVNHTPNCCLINLDDMLQNGTVISGTRIDKPHSFSTACTIATQIIAQVSSNQYGGQSISLTHLAPFVDVTRQSIKKKVIKDFEEMVELGEIGKFPKDETIDRLVEKRVKDDVKKGIQTIQYQVVTLLTTNGQAPFITVFMYLGEAKEEKLKSDLALIIEETLTQRIQGVKNEKGVWVTPAFPKLIYVLEEDNVWEDSRFYYLTRLAARCSAKRLVPDYISEKKMKEIKEGNCFPCMGCRSFLTPWKDENGEYKFYGRFNKGVVTINLVDVACSSNKDMDNFWKIFDERLELCHKALICKYERLKDTPSDVAPIMWQHGAIARLKKGETIDKLLVGGYSTISLGYAGLWETVYHMTGQKLTTEVGKEFGLKIMKYMNEKCEKWNSELNLGFGLYGTPLESTSYRFAKALQKRFGIIEGVTDKNYITNSYHIHVTEPINSFDKLAFESEFQSLSTGGAISYVEASNLTHNEEAMLAQIQYIYKILMYGEINIKSDYCQECGYDGEIQIVEDGNKLVWECPNCKNRDENKMNVARRTCGYIGTNFWDAGRTQEIKERYVHLGGNE